MRLFVALDLPEDVVAALEEVGQAAERPGLRVLPASSYHVTLAFLGERDEAVVPALAAAVHDAVASGPGPVAGLALRAPAWLGRRSVLAVDLADPSGAAAALHARLTAGLVAAADFTPDERPFRPHVTIARARRGARVAGALPDVPPRPPFAATAVTLYESRLGPGGARYAPLARADLPRA